MLFDSVAISLTVLEIAASGYRPPRDDVMMFQNIRSTSLRAVGAFRRRGNLHHVLGIASSQEHAPRNDVKIFYARRNTILRLHHDKRAQHRSLHWHHQQP